MRRKRTLKQNKAALSHWAIEAIHAEEVLKNQFVGQQKALAYMAGIYATYRCGLQSGLDWLAPRTICTGALSSGKTSSIRAVAKLLGLPYAVASFGNLSPSGYKGGTLTDAFSSLIAQAGSLKRLEQRGAILHIDEICKYSVHRRTDQFYESLIYNFLGVLGGEIVQVDAGDGFENALQLKTNRILVFLSGAFTNVNPSSWRTEDLALKTMVKLQYPKEFISRISGHVHFEKLNDSQMRSAIEREANQMRTIYRMGSDNPIITNKEITQVLAKIKKSGLGLRSSRFYLQNRLIESALNERYSSLV